jgi:type I restriction enzyme S subunit
MPKNWKTYKLGDIAKLRKAGIKPSEFNGEKYIGLEHIGQGNFHLDGTGKASDVKSNKSKFVEGDILYGKIRPYFKKVYRPKFSGICSTDMLIFNTKNEDLVSQSYLHQFIKTQEFTDKATETSTGTKMPRADWNSLKLWEFPFPPLKEQTQIANILSAIDNKIENNLATNKTLEDMAMALYKHWFVDFGPFQDGEFIDSELGLIPKGWEVKRLEELIEIKYGKDHKKLNDGNIPVYGSGGIMRYVDTFLYDKESILIPRKGTLSNLFYITEPFWSVDTMFYSKIKNSTFGKYIFHFLKSLDLASMDVGSAVPSLTTNLLKRIDVIVPAISEIEKFDIEISRFFEEMKLNTNENQTLTKLRDTLLPKLISGEVRLKEFREQVENGIARNEAIS